MQRFRARSSGPLAAAALTLLAGSAVPALAQGQPNATTRPHAGMLRFPDVSATSIVFVYANDLWIVPREGGVARPLASPPGPERFPRFSPDGKSIAFMGNYDGNLDLYTVSVDGGIPARVTHHPGAEQLTDWTADNRLLWFGGGLGGNPRISEVWTSPAAGGMPSKLPVPYGANGAISADGTWLAYTPHTIDGRTWKRYRGGMATDIWLYNLKDNTSKKATDWEGTDSQPMWHNGKLYYMSDAGPEHRLNIWSFDPASGTREQVTKFKDYDIKWPAIGPGDKGQGEIVLQNGSGLYLVDLATKQHRQVAVEVPGARPQLRTRSVDASRNINGASLSPSAKRVALEARGDIWTAPAEKGTPRNLTRTSGTFERDPAWSPNGKWVAYFADTTGEYELYIIRSDGRDDESDAPAEPIQLTKNGLGGGGPFKFNSQWTPDSKHITFQDKTGARFIYTLDEALTKIDEGKDEKKDEKSTSDKETKSDEKKSDDKAEDKKGENKRDEDNKSDDKKDAKKEPPAPPAVAGIVEFDKDPRNNLSGVSFSHDSRYIAYVRGNDENPGASVWIYDIRTKEKHRITSGFFDDASVTFDRAGDWLYVSSSRSFSPRYGELDTSFIYANTHDIIAIPLRKDVKSPYLATSDEEEFGKKKDKDKKDDSKKDDSKKDDAKSDEKKDGDKDKKDDKKDAAKADDVISGAWSCKASGPPPLPPEGLPFTLELKLDDAGKVTGTLTSLMFTGPVTGSWDKSSKVLTLNFQAGEQAITLNLNVSGSSLSGAVTVQDQKYTVSGDKKPSEDKPGESGSDKDKKDGDKDKDKKKTFEIDYEGIEARAFELPIRSGVFGQLGVNDKGQLIYVRRVARGDEGSTGIKLFDPKDDKKEEKNVADGGGFELSADGKKIMIFRGGAPSIADAAANASAKGIVTAPMMQVVEPRAEWAQILTDTNRIFRDWFYVSNMHGVDWSGAVLKQYQAMLPDAANREDVNYIISEMISELNVGHAYLNAPGDVEQGGPTVGVGLLGCDFELTAPQGGAEKGAYRIKKIIKAADWDTDARSPLAKPGVDVKEGDYLLAVNGVPVDTSRDPWSAFLGLDGRSVTITVSENPKLDSKARNVVVETLGNDGQIRYRAWIESKRKYVEDKTEGKVGYIYVPNTGIDGQSDLVRQFYGQIGKQALIIDERWNGGGQIPTRFIELLNRPATNYWAVRDAKDWQWPPDSQQGPKCMLINGLAGSGGDMFPWLFKHNKLGKLIGSRTWGGLVGISGNPGLIDGGTISVPTFGFYELDGTWGIEGHGVDPDIAIVDDPAQMQSGNDPQLNAAIELMLSEIKTNGFKAPKRPSDPDRRGMGLPDADR